jgi:hypothetical protein
LQGAGDLADGDAEFGGAGAIDLDAGLGAGGLEVRVDEAEFRALGGGFEEFRQGLGEALEGWSPG